VESQEKKGKYFCVSKTGKGKGKAILLQAWSGAERSRS